MADNDSRESRRNDGVAFDRAQLLGQGTADLGSDVGILQEERALEIFPAVQPRAEDEMPLKQRAVRRNKASKSLLVSVIEPSRKYRPRFPSRRRGRRSR